MAGRSTVSECVVPESVASEYVVNRAGRGIYVWVVATLGAALLFAHTGFAAPLVSQENPPEQPAAGDAASQFFDAVDVDVANIDVMVTDRQGQPVTGLTADDFTIFIDDERVELTNFFEARGAIEGDLSIGASTDEPQAERGASRREPLHLVVVVDNRNIRPENRNRLTRRLRDALDELSFFDAVPSGRRLMVAELNRGLDVVVPFTSDRPVIAQALHGIEKNGSLNALLDSERRVFLNRLQSASLRHYNPRESKRFPGVHASTGGLQAFEDPAFDDAISLALKLANDVRHLAERRFQQAKSTTLALGDLCDTLGGMPGRKALLYVSDGLPLRPADSLFEAWSNKYQNWALHNQKDFDKSNYPDAGQTFSRIETALGSSEFDLRGELDQLTSRASTNRVAFYPISGSGRNSDLVSAAVSGGGVGGGAPHSTREAQHMENFTRDASLLQMADDTGGQALIRSTNLGELLQRLTRDFDTFYALGYPAIPLEGQKRGNRSHEVRVEVHRDDVVVRHGNAYRPRHWRDRLGAMTLASALFETQDNVLGAVLDPGSQVQEGKRFRVPIMLTIPFDQIRMVYKDEHYRGQLTAVVVVRDEEDGGYSEPQRIDFPIKIPGRQIMEAAQRQAGYLLQLEMAEGPKRIAVGIRDHISQTESTVHLDLVVGESL